MTTPRAAFTLIELLLVMLISSVLVLGINASFRQAHALLARAERERSVHNELRLITQTLRRELFALYLPPAPDANQDGPDQQPFQPMSVNGTQLTFFTLAPAWKTPPTLARIARLRYSFQPDPDTRQPVLLRFEQPYSGEKPIGTETSAVVTASLSDFTVTPVAAEQTDPEKKDAAPAAVKILMTWPPLNGFPSLTFEATVPIPVRNPLASK
jgi:prepilin-type N-terminal cleavage/methylation domain-containing protein